MGKMHESFERTYDPAAPSARQFGIVFALVFGVICVWPVLGGQPPRWWSFAVAAGLLAIALLRPRWLARPSRWWMRFAALAGHIVGTLALAILYYSTVVPTGLLMRLFGKDSLHLEFDKEAKSYWIERDQQPAEQDSFTRQF
jgi:hypothetical protein